MNTTIEKPKIMFVDDEQNILNAIKRLMRKEGYEVFTTIEPSEALGWAQEHTFALIVSDQRMPIMEGTELLSLIREVAPETVRVILTGYADIEAAIKAINNGAVYRFLTKPWEDQDLKVAIRQAVDQYMLVSENKRLSEENEAQNDELKRLNVELKDLNQGLERRVQERTSTIGKLNKNLEKSFLGAVTVMAKLAEDHSSSIGSHSKRVASVCREVGKRMGFKGQELLHLVVAATLHDIGKVAVPQEILAKNSDVLKMHEKEVLRNHVTTGEALIKLMPNMRPVAEMVRHHHEFFNGKGYPDGLKGEEIPLGSRIIAIADAYDHALYANPFEGSPRQRAVKIVQAGCPVMYDADIVTELHGYVQEVVQREDAAAEEGGEGGRHKGDTLQENIELEVRAEDLRPGMVIAQDLRTARGIMLLPKGTSIRSMHLDRIRHYQDVDPIVETVHVHWKNPKYLKKDEGDES